MPSLPRPAARVEPEAIALARVPAALVEIPDGCPGGDVEAPADRWPAWTDDFVYEPVDASYIPPADTPADATRDEWLDALGRGQIGAPEPEPMITPAMETAAAFRQALMATFGDPDDLRHREYRGGHGHPAGEP